MSDTYLHPEAIATAEWLEAHLDDPGLWIFECTTYLDPPTEGVDAPYTVRSGRADFDAGHIPGAGCLDLQAELSDNASPSHLRFTMPSPEALARAFGERGVGDDSRVVLYSRVNMQWATRVWWMLRSIGFDDAAVLDGGWEKWTLDGRPTSTAPCTYAPADLTARPREGLFVGKEAMKAAMEDGAICSINALSPELHRGEGGRYGRAGRIPGSVNLPALGWQDETDRTFAPAPVVAAALREAGAKQQGPSYVYCGGGIAATLDAFLMYQLGYENVAVYDASMSEWARDESLPVETG